APSRKPVIITIHDLSFIKTPQFAHPRLARYLSGAVPRAIDRASAIVAVSQATADDILETYPAARGKVVAIPNGVDPVFVQPGAALIDASLQRLGILHPYFVIVGTIEPRKNHLGVLKAFEWAHERRPELSLVIAGRPGWLSEPIMSAIRSDSTRLPVIHLEGLSDDELAAVIAGSLALVYPSWYEGFGLPVAEAMAGGTAVITSRGGALEEVAGGAALLVDPADVEGMAEAMVKLYDDPALRRQLIERGNERVRWLTWERSAASHWALYRKVAFG
ncbi:MAG TPA: glycosyltransferase family 1 protein, partial [Thermomicrobiaceae bacterium]|nr:glycosyltransferase family 1 protein [Thermomicrobiaceae bacterium]